jgi:hypothetical protein
MTPDSLLSPTDRKVIAKLDNKKIQTQLEEKGPMEMSNPDPKKGENWDAPAQKKQKKYLTHFNSPCPVHVSFLDTRVASFPFFSSIQTANMPNPQENKSSFGSMVFCQRCGNLLASIGQEGSVTCEVCSLTHTADAFEHFKVVTQSARGAFPSILKSKRGLVQKRGADREKAATVRDFFLPSRILGAW